jgi:signal transduction histidine kinase
MKTGHKLFLGFSIVIVLLWVIVFFARSTQGNIRAEFDVLEEEVIPGVLEINEMVVLANEIAHAATEYIYTGEEETKETVVSGTERLENLGLSYVERKKLIGSEEQEKAERLVNKIEVFNTSISGLVYYKDLGKDVDINVELLIEMERSTQWLVADMIEDFEEYRHNHMQELAAAQAAVRQEYNVGTRVLYTVAGLTTMLAIAGAFLVTRAIVRPLHALHKGTEIIGQGNLDHRVGTKARDEIGQLSQAFDQMTDGLAKTTASITELNKEIAHREKIEKELQKKNVQLDSQNTKLQELERLKSVFLASMSHELRTPLNAIIGFTSLILQGMVGEINEEQKKQLALVDSSAQHLLSLINDVLDIAKIEAGKVELSLEEFPLDELMKEVVGILIPIAELKNIKLEGNAPEGVILYSDRRRLKQILINLTGNAVKFTDRGCVNVRAELSGRDRLTVSVNDTGIGMKKEDVEKLFIPFQQAGDSLVKKQQGTGLGLYLSRKLVNLLGGDITVKSKFGKGSEFAFTLPLKYTEVNKNEESVDYR